MTILKNTEDTNISLLKRLITPKELKTQVLLHEEAKKTILSSRNTIANILNGKDPRKFIILGPCSIHDEMAAKEYAQLLLELSFKVKDTLFLVMRSYFEKPRTSIGWKGFINDPGLDNSFLVNDGLLHARRLLMEITSLGLPVATEALDPIIPQYLFDFISWAAIGARTSESQTHRELASGLSAPIGFKNNTDGNIEVAINAMKSALRSHHFLGIDEDGQTSIIVTKGNPLCHLILRGGKDRPNYDTVSVKMAQDSLIANNLNPRLVIDCSHDNSSKDFKNQPMVFMDCIKQVINGNENLVGFMLESHINEGSQSLGSNLKYGVSITDGCISFSHTKDLIYDAYKDLRQL